MLTLANGHRIAAEELAWTPIRSRGAGGQHVNTTETGVQLRYDVVRGRLPEGWKRRVLASGDQRVTTDGVVVIRADRHRSQEQNRREALTRLRQLLLAYARAPTPRRVTRPSLAERRRRLEAKRQRGQVKAARRKPEP